MRIYAEYSNLAVNLLEKMRRTTKSLDSLSCFLASLTFRAALVRSSWTMYSLHENERNTCLLKQVRAHRSSLIANMPASVTTFRRSAPLNASVSYKPGKMDR